MSYYHIVTFDGDKPLSLPISTVTYKRKKDIIYDDKVKAYRMIVGEKPELINKPITLGTYILHVGCQFLWLKRPEEIVGLIECIDGLDDKQKDECVDVFWNAISSNTVGTFKYNSDIYLVVKI